MANHYTFGIGQPHTEVEDALPPVTYDETTQSLVSGDGTMNFVFTLVTNAELLASFPLKASLVASTYQGTDSTATYARTGPTTVRDHLGYLQYCRANEAPFRGARRVENLAADSESFVTGWTLGASCTLSAISGGWKVTRSSGLANMLTFNSAAYEPGQHTASATLSISSGTATVRMRIERSSDSATVVQKDFAITTAPQRFGGFGVITDTSNHRVSFTIASGAPVEFNIAKFQFERTEGQSGAPNDYVSRGVAGAAYPFAGAGVDGVQYFDTINPCYLEASTGVVEVDGTSGGIAISAETMKGIHRSPVGVQRFVYSSVLTDASWTKTGLGTPVSQTAIKNPIGYGRLYSLVETAVTSEFTASNPWSATVPGDNVNIAVSAFAKAGLNRKWLRLGLINKAGAVEQLWFDLLAGTLGRISGSFTEKEVVVEEYPNGVWRVGFSAGSGAGGTTPSGFVGVADSDGSSSYAGVAGNCIYAGGLQFEANDMPTAYIANTSGAAVTRQEATLTVPIVSNVPSNDFTIGVNFTPLYHTDTTRKSGFYYIVYSELNATNRWGTALRPGVFGGNTRDLLASGWAQDYYFDSAAFGGVNITLGTVAQPGETVTQYFGQSSVPQQSNGDGSFMSVNNVVAYPTSTATPTVAPIANKQTYLSLGSATVTGLHDACYKNLTVYDRPFTAYELRLV